jgi:hypothetical protein
VRRYRRHGKGSHHADQGRSAAMPDLRQARDVASSAFLLGALHPDRSRALAQRQLQRSHRRAAGGHARGARARGVARGGPGSAYPVQPAIRSEAGDELSRSTVQGCCAFRRRRRARITCRASASRCSRKRHSLAQARFRQCPVPGTQPHSCAQRRASGWAANSISLTSSGDRPGSETSIGSNIASCFGNAR